jgi:hypothetical protein
MKNNDIFSEVSFADYKDISNKQYKLNIYLNNSTFIPP